MSTPTKQIPCSQGSEEMCQCGCRGWCSLYPLLLEWVSDLKRLESGPVRYAVVDIQGDWPAFLQVFGLRYWSHNLHPCPLCRIDQKQLKELHLDSWTLDSMPFDSYGTNDYKNDVRNFVQASLLYTGTFLKIWWSSANGFQKVSTLQRL